MEPGRKVPLVWLAAAGLIALLALPLAGPLTKAWHGYLLHQNGEREQAELLHKLEHDRFALNIVAGSHRGQGCTVSTSPALYDAAEPGERFEVVYVEWQPGECELASTLEASGILFALMSAALALLVVVVLGLALFASRSFTRAEEPPRRLPADPEAVRCPACGKPMQEGYVPILSGIHWRRLGAPIGLPHVLSGLPGTVGWRGRPRLHAFRCEPCEILTLQYGTPRAHD